MRFFFGIADNTLTFSEARSRARRRREAVGVDFAGGFSGVATPPGAP